MTDKTGKQIKYPLKMRPVFKDYLWGGTRLKDEYNKKTTLPIVAESWEVSCHPDGLSIIDNGELSGMTLETVLKSYPELMGHLCAGLKEFPLLIKLIDARQLLSLQVHPDDKYAFDKEKQSGKNEMWYIAAAKPGAELILGFNEQLTKDEIKTAIRNNELLQKTKRVPVTAGECYCVPAGLLHAICEGVIIVEVQQNSNLTYRVYDYDRKDNNGNRRELHIEKAVDVLDTTLQAVNSTSSLLTDWQYFTCELITVENEIDFHCGNESFQCLVIIEGELSLISENIENKDTHNLSLKKGETAFIPASMGKYKLNGNAELIIVSMT